MLPAIPAVAALSANHLAALLLPSVLRRLYIARDADTEGLRAYEMLRARAEAAGGPEVRELVPAADDFNADLMRLGPRGLALHLAPQLAEADVVTRLRFEGDATDAAA